MTVRSVFIELSPTPIYRRIALALGAELVRQGLEVQLVKPTGFDAESFSGFVEAAGGNEVGYVSTASSNIVQSRHPLRGSHYFERFSGPIVFVHQDAILGGQDLLAGISKLQAWQRVGGRSAHLCIESDSVGDLVAAGIPNAALVQHASEIQPMAPVLEGFDTETSFVGHVLPSGSYVQNASSPRLQELLTAAVDARRSDFSTPLEPLVKSFSARALDGLGTAADQAVLRVAQAQWLRNTITGETMRFRGWVFEGAEFPLEIFGGDPAYLHGVDRQWRIGRPGVQYHPAVYDEEGLQRVYQRSCVNVNVSSLQFDHAVVNRVHDVFMAGGLCLTDQRSGLADLTSQHAEISFRTVEELHERVRFYARPEHARERALLIQAVQRDVAQRSGYGPLARAVRQAFAAL